MCLADIDDTEVQLNNDEDYRNSKQSCSSGVPVHNSHKC